MTHDPREAVDADGFVVTGVGREKVSTHYAPLVEEAAAEAARAFGDEYGLYLYGSVATGQATPPSSDLDLLLVTSDDVAERCRSLSVSLSASFADRARSVGLSMIDPFDPDRDPRQQAADRCFLRDYSVHVHGPDLAAAFSPTRADLALAWGFNGDIGTALARAMARQSNSPTDERRRVIAHASRRALMAAATLLSVRDGSWSTDRARGADLLGRHEPDLHGAAASLLDWSRLDTSIAPLPSVGGVEAVLEPVLGWLAPAHGAADIASRHLGDSAPQGGPGGGHEESRDDNSW